jgi:plasmid stability protein
MPTLYVENVPKDVYEALRKRAGANRTSIAAEVISLLEQFVPTAEDLKRRRKAFDNLAKLRAMPALTLGPYQSAEEMIREDRDR